MVGSCFSVAVFCAGGALLSLILKQYCSEHSLLLSVAVCASVFTGAVLMLEAPVKEIREIFSAAGIPESYAAVMFKALAISCIIHITSGLCSDSGESAMGAAAELWGRAALIVICMPVLKGFIEIIGTLM